MLYYCTSVSLVLFTYIYDFKQNQQKVLEPQRTAVAGNYLCQELFPTSCLPPHAHNSRLLWSVVLHSVHCVCCSKYR